MVSGLAASAAANNAAWCDRVCRAHGRPGEFLHSLWVNRAQVPVFYPNAVTLTAGDEARQLEQLSRLDVPGRWAVKDSFAALELAPRGFSELFTAQWIVLSHAARASAPASGARWLTVRDEATLAAWEAVWRGPPGEHRRELAQAIFQPALLDDADTRVLAAFSGDALIGGAIAYRAAGVVSLSNTFLAKGASEALRAEMLVQICAAFPGLPLVGYERGDALSTWCSLGFEPLGALRVWQKTAGS
jgi:hypothetical protein